VPVHEPEVAARLGYGDGTFPPGRHRDEDHHDARAALLAAEAEAARLLRTGPAPVAVAARPGDPHDRDDLVVVSAAVDRLERSLEQVADAASHARCLVVTGDPSAGQDPPDAGTDERRAERLRQAVRTVAGAGAGGLAVVGGFHQPAVDGYEWHRGFDARLGLFDRDRTPRPALTALPRPPAGTEAEVTETRSDADAGTGAAG
jgi:beta-glucosidase/6-phospho-beta-glucosidase/beta-galactosidase